jgi:hypothetical protein
MYKNIEKRKKKEKKKREDIEALAKRYLSPATKK